LPDFRAFFVFARRAANAIHAQNRPVENGSQSETTVVKISREVAASRASEEVAATALQAPLADRRKDSSRARQRRAWLCPTVAEAGFTCVNDWTVKARFGARQTPLGAS
jgi:hypothetical protein